ncbi:hypothetical protein B4N89_20765 [Embleya scabrispora]|uniref:Uncharacterized protein n=1 Tax=Embleya scabrispora TaxID=159449 RepID=A0A1T3P1S3_9ACTN|nr:hypothetical protein B4N89_20765 [Embleya scabrispora]
MTNRHQDTGGGPHACPRCSAPVLHSPTDGHLDADPHLYGPYLPGGGSITTDQALDALSTGTPAGHRRHMCPPPTCTQLTLI